MMKKSLLFLIGLFSFSLSFPQYNTNQIEEHLNRFNQYKYELPESARHHLDKATFLAKEQKDSSRLSQLLDYSGWLLSRKGEHLEALSTLKDALQLSRQTSNRSREAIILNHLMGLYAEMGLLDSSLWYGFESLYARENLKDTVMIVKAFVNLATTYSKLKNFEEAIAMQERTIQLAKLSSQDISLTNSYINLIKYYDEIGNESKWEELLPQAISECNTACTESQLAILNLYQGAFELKSDNYYEAIAFLNKAEDQFLKLAEYNYLSAVLRLIGSCYKALGDNDKTILALQKSLSYAERSKSLTEQKNINQYLFEYFYSKKEFDLALQYKIRRDEINDSLQSPRTMWNVNKIHSDIVQRKSQEIIQEKEATIAEKEKVNLLLQLIGGLALVIVAGTLYSYRTIKRKNRVIQDQNHDLSQYNFELLHNIDEKDHELMSTRKSVETVISRVSHDVRGKVATLKLLTSLAKSEDPSVRDYLSKISSTAKDADTTIAGLTALSRIRTRNPVIEQVKLPNRLLRFFNDSEGSREIWIKTDAILFFQIEDILLKMDEDDSEKLTIEELGNLLILMIEINTPEDIDSLNDYLKGKEDFHPNMEFDFMQLKVASEKTGGRVRVIDHGTKSVVRVELPR